MIGVKGGGLERDGLKIARDSRIDRTRTRRALLLQPLAQTISVRVIEGGSKCEQFVERQSQTVDVTARIRLALELFGRHISQSAHEVTGLRQVLLFRQLDQPEVGDPDGSSRIHEQVRRLDVAVQDALRVGIVQGPGHLHADFSDVSPIRQIGPRRGKRWDWLRQDFIKSSALDVLHDVVVQVILFAHSENGDNVRVM